MESAVAKFETARLLAQRLEESDYADYQRLGQEPRVRAWLGGKLLTDGEVRQTLADSENHWQTHGFGIWTLRELASGAFVGRVGLRHCRVEGTPEVELLYTLLPEFWNRGFATEVSREVLRIGLLVLQLPTIVAYTQPHNLASRRVMEKCGLVYERPFTHANLPHVLYRTP
ncbi:MAG: GNAT family N-acetyltransferase [Pirellulaceae bacterium]|nr:GNAT family N-acetyltransferase [Pirellulaceae bacterium]